MISFFPLRKETISLFIDRNEFNKRLEKHIYTNSSDRLLGMSKDHLFSGEINNDSFSISQNLKIPNRFTPTIKGVYEKYENSILLHLTFELQSGSKNKLLIWTSLTLILSLYFSLLYSAWLYAAISFGICLVNYILSIENFNTQVKKSKRRLNKMLD